MAINPDEHNGHDKPSGEPRDGVGIVQHVELDDRAIEKITALLTEQGEKRGFMAYLDGFAAKAKGLEDFLDKAFNDEQSAYIKTAVNNNQDAFMARLESEFQKDSDFLDKVYEDPQVLLNIAHDINKAAEPVQTAKADTGTTTDAAEKANPENEASAPPAYVKPEGGIPEAPSSTGNLFSMDMLRNIPILGPIIEFLGKLLQAFTGSDSLAILASGDPQKPGKAMAQATADLNNNGAGMEDTPVVKPDGTETTVAKNEQKHTTPEPTDLARPTGPEAASAGPEQSPMTGIMS